LKKATDAGGKVVFPATKVGPTTTIALFSDPDGNVIGLTDGN
jgi:predicted enzyme related to lactoylglutathione lyase